MSEHALASMPASRKRSHDEAEGPQRPKVSIEISEEAQLPTPNGVTASQTAPEPKRQLSPPISIESSILSDAKTMTPSAIQSTPPSAPGPGAAKKQKLTFAQKEQLKAFKQFEKEAKERKKAEEAQRKEQDRLARDEEKRQKEEEKEATRIKVELEKAEKQKVKDFEKRKKEKEKKFKDAEKQAKEDAKRKKEEEKKRKEQSQLRLGSFFQKPVVGEASEERSSASSRRSSVVSLLGIEDLEKEAPTKASPQKKPEATYGFLSFFIMKYVNVAPPNRFVEDENLANMAASRLDARMKQESSLQTEDLISTFRSRKRQCCQKPRCTMKEIVDSIQGTPTSTVDLTCEITSPQLSEVPYKILSFKEDVRPPYKGTYTRAVSPKSTLKLSRCPFTRHLPDTNYDYDSEAEWEPPNEDDENLESGDEESDLGEEGEEDLDGFLDDEDDPGRRKQIVGEMTPVSSGLCFSNVQDERGPLEDYRMQTLSEEHVFPIDPFSTAYWPKLQHQPKQAVMQPPRLPLSNLNPNRSPSMTPPSVNGEAQQTSDTLCPNPGPTKAQAAPAGKPLRLAPADVLPAFKQAILGSDLTKAGLIEILKKQ